MDLTVRQEIELIKELKDYRDIEHFITSTAIKYGCKNREVIEAMPLDIYVKTLIELEKIPNINRLENFFSKDWLNNIGDKVN